MGIVIAIIYLIGVFASIVVGRSRVGISQMGRLSATTVVTSMPWFLTQMATMIVWPVFLATWIVRGRPRTPWKAVTSQGGSIRVRRRLANENS